MKNTEDIKLQVPEPEDIDILLSWENNTEIWRAGSTNIPYSRFAMEQFILQAKEDAFEQKQLRFMIRLCTNNKAIGTVDLYDIDALNRRAGIGILISEEYRGKGYALQALEKVKEYSFLQLQLQQIFAKIKQNNQKSIELFKKAGYQQSGFLKAWYMNAEDFTGETIMQLFNPAYHE